MHESFRATVNFALLALACIFVANLIGWMATDSIAHTLGVVVSIAAIGAANLAQAQFTEAAQWAELSRPGPGETSPDLDAENAEAAAEKRGDRIRLVCWACAACAVLLFLAGS